MALRRTDKIKTWMNALATALTLLPLAAGTALAQASRQAGGTLTIGFGAEATMMDPTRSAAGVDQYYLGQMFEQLDRTDPSLKTVNLLAETWELTHQDGKPVGLPGDPGTGICTASSRARAGA